MAQEAQSSDKFRIAGVHWEYWACETWRSVCMNDDGYLRIVDWRIVCVLSAKIATGFFVSFFTVPRTHPRGESE